ncbi:zinc finger protein 85-like isoform X1 [Cydia pomonella]|uniref:zinc finger protein 85-like isoform X1 n=1 Tax=Cydia pomonella TaxID=82600 RepID=UPI002ADDAE2E|nr:zinc finger protein 85-like isoform X1 [Cydia pomonella]
MDVLNSCRCCLRCPPDKDLTTSYTHFGKLEIYSHMLKDCFDLHLSVDGNVSHGICLTCVGRLRDASDFKLQVQRSQAELEAVLLAKVEPMIKIEVADESTGDESAFVTLYEVPPERAETAGEDEPDVVLQTDPLVKSETPTDMDDEDSSRSAVATSSSGEKLYTCEECKTGFRNKLILSKHIQDSHISPGLSLDSTKNRQFSNTSSSTKIKLNKKGEQITELKCTQCDYKTISKRNFNKHKNYHFDEEQLNCKHCDYVARYKGHLRLHQVIHSRSSYTCECGFKCRWESELRRHKWVHTGEKPYSCKHCDYKCRQMTNLRTHERVHTSGKPFKCDRSDCEYASRYKQALVRHYKTKHREKHGGS